MNRLIKQAFTLIELLVVIAIIGILSGLIVVSMGGMTDKANIAKSQVFSNSLRNSLMLNLISEWKFDEISTAVQGSAIQDTWKGGNAGTLSTNSDGLDKIKTGTSCVSGNCLSFDGTDDYIQITGSNVSTSNLAITGAITLSTWVKFNLNGAAQTVLSRGIIAMNGDYGYVLWKDSTNQIWFDTHSTTVVIELQSGTAYTDSNWHHLVATWDGTTNTNTKKLYVDGILKGQQTSTFAAMGQPSYFFRIGRDGGLNYPLNGLVDDVRVFNAVMSISQAKEQYYTGLNSLLTNGSISKLEYINKINETAQK